MAEYARNEPLYQQALSAALGELHTLSSQIETLQNQLDRLERQKVAVESICRAIGQWVEAQETEQRQDPETYDTYEGSVGLTEEEVSLIAYPARLPHEA